MKKLIHYSTILALIVGFYACSNEEINNLQHENNQTRTYATFTIEKDLNSKSLISDTSETDQIRDLRFIIFNENSQKCELNQVVTQTSGSHTFLLTQFGKSRIFVIANAESKNDIKTLLDSIKPGTTRLFQFYEMVYDLEENPTQNGPVSNINKLTRLVDNSTGHIMSNGVDSTSNFIIYPSIAENDSKQGGTENNNFTIKIQRAVSKVTLYYDNNTLSITDGTGIIKDLKYSINNINRSVYLFQQFSGNNIITPNTNQPASPSFEEAQKLYYNSNDVLELAGGGISGKNAVYITENTHDINKAMIINSTYILVEGTLVPKIQNIIEDFQYDSIIHKFAIKNPISFTEGIDLYKVAFSSDSGMPQTAFFTDSITAYKALFCIKYGTETGFNVNRIDELRNSEEKVLKFNNSKCYYRIDLGLNNNIYAIKRNHHYRVQIASFNTVGENLKSNITHPNKWTGQPQPTYLSSKISVVPWIIDDSVYPYQ